MNKNFLSAPVLSLALVAVGIVGCKSDAPKTAEPSRSAVMAARAPIASYRSQLDQIRPRMNATLDSASNMLVNANTDPKAAIATFTQNVTALRADTQAMRTQVDELERLGFDQYFLGADRTTAITSDPAVTDARTRYGFVGDYMTGLRNEGMSTMTTLENISTAVNANPTAAGIMSQVSEIRSLSQSKIKLNSLMDQLSKAIDTMPRR